MKVVQVRQPGGPQALLLTDLPIPQPGPREVLIRAHAIGVSGADALIRKGIYKWMPPLPAIPGNDMAGVVEARGAEVSELALGQRVLVSARELAERGGCYAEYRCVLADAPFPIPDTITFDEAVCLSNFQLAHAMLLGCNNGIAVQSILVPGAAGGVASALIQLARHHGIRVIGTTSTPEKRDYALANGAHEVIAPDPASLPERVRALTQGQGVDLAFDHVGGALLIACIRALAPLGTAVSYNIIGGPPEGDVFAELRALLGKSLAVRTFSIHTFDAQRDQRRALMARAIALMAAGQVRAPRTTVYPLAEVRHVHEQLDSGQALGKLVLQP